MSTRSKLQITQRPVGDVTVVILEGEIALDDGDLALGRYIDDLVKAGRVKIVLDMSGVTYIDSAGVGMMVAELKLVRSHDGAMRLAALSARSEHLLAMLKLKIVFEVFEDVDAAVRSFAWGR